MKIKIKVSLILLVCMVFIFTAGCAKEDSGQGILKERDNYEANMGSTGTRNNDAGKNEEGNTGNQGNEDIKGQEDGNSAEKGANPVVTIEMQNGDKIKVELYPDVAPNTVRNFISLVRKGFYDGLVFHRVVDGFVIQGGDPEGTGTGGPGYFIRGEFKANGFENDLKHTRGVISMARYPENFDSAGSQFFILVEDQPHLDGEYAAFGKVTEGMEVVDRISGVKTDMFDRPVEDQVIKKMTVELFGQEYEEPEKVEF